MNQASSQPCAGVVMVVEDEEDSREILRELLENRGHAVATAEDGLVAMDLLNKTALPPVCLVLLDLIMPRMDGFEVLRTLAQDPRFSRIPVCVTTSAPDKVPPGIQCLPKPVDVNQLYALVDERCGKKELVP